MGIIEYTVASIDGDYAYLKNETQETEDNELKCVARALLPPEIGEGTRLAYEMFEYRIL